MDFDIEEQIETQHLFLVNRMCRVCGKEKNLISDFYLSRKDRTLASSYAYECKECTSKRIRDYDKKYKLGTCIICERRNVKVSADLCKKCHKLIRYDVDTLQKAVLYLQKNNR